MVAEDDRYAFLADYFDSTADLVRSYTLIYWPADRSVELIDMKTRRVFLKRISVPSITLDQLYIGGTATVYSRQMKIMAYADEYTRRQLGSARQSSAVVITALAADHLGDVLSQLYSRGGTTVKNIKSVKFTEALAKEFARTAGVSEVSNLAGDLIKDGCVAVEVVGEECVDKLQRLIKSSDAFLGVHASASAEHSQKELMMLFDDNKLGSTAVMQDCTVCVVKPHAVRDGLLGAVVGDVVKEGFHISAMELFHMDKTSVKEFLEAYQTVLPEYHEIVEELSTGPVVALEIRAADAVNAFRAFAGPHDPEIARQLRNKTLRARYGRDRVHNAVHCTDLPDDGVLDSQYFFDILQQKQ